ncbi:hypothetical protein, partial [uncultured Alistipes sp.]
MIGKIRRIRCWYVALRQPIEEIYFFTFPENPDNSFLPPAEGATAPYDRGVLKDFSATAFKPEKISWGDCKVTISYLEM